MKEKNSFDIPGYKFGILKLNKLADLTLQEEQNIATISQIISNETNQGKVRLIPFENLDGLTLAEVLSVLDIQGPLILSCYVEFKGVGKNHIENNLNTLQNFLFPKEDLDENTDISIDNLLETKLESFYKSSPDNVKRMIRCFFERYQDKTHEDTVERIQKINIRK